VASIIRKTTKAPARDAGAHAPRQRRCRRIFALLSDYLDGKLTVRQSRHIEAHLYDCLPCQCFLDDLKRSVALCRGVRPEVLDPALAKEVRQQIVEAVAKVRSKK
jgi:predicted anti-sigma-YlaC factor YlaD